ncbi:MAG: DUF4783 domain-containing protein [Bacteroidales bacterium]
MKFIILSVAAFLTVFILAATNQEQARIPAGITNAIKSGNSIELSKFMNSTVELLVLDKEDFYKKNVAETILKDFFNSHHVKDFIIRHQGGSNDAQYAIGNLKTESGDFRVHILLKKVGQELLIHQVRIEPDNEK